MRRWLLVAIGGPEDPTRWWPDGGTALVDRLGAVVFCLAALLGLAVAVPAAVAGAREATAHHVGEERTTGVVVDGTDEGGLALAVRHRWPGEEEQVAWLRVSSLHPYEPGQRVEVVRHPASDHGPFIEGEGCGCPTNPLPALAVGSLALAGVGASIVLPARRRTRARGQHRAASWSLNQRPLEVWWLGPDHDLAVLHDSRRERVGAVWLPRLARSVVANGSVLSTTWPPPMGEPLVLSSPGIEVISIGPPVSPAAVLIRPRGVLRTPRRIREAVASTDLLDIDPRRDGSTARHRWRAATGMAVAKGVTPAALGFVAMGTQLPGWAAAGRLLVGTGLACAAIGLGTALWEEVRRKLELRRTAAVTSPRSKAAPPTVLADDAVGAAPVGAADPSTGDRLVLFDERPQLERRIHPAPGFWLGNRLTVAVAGAIAMAMLVVTPPAAALLLGGLLWSRRVRVAGRRAWYRRPAAPWWAAAALLIGAAIGWQAAITTSGPDAVATPWRVAGAVAVAPLCWMAWRLIRAGVVVGEHEVVVRNVWSTARIPVEQVATVEQPAGRRFPPAAGLCIRRGDGSTVRASRWAVSWPMARRAVLAERGRWPACDGPTSTESLAAAQSSTRRAALDR